MKYPYGISDFYEIISEGYLYFDRTHIIREIEDAGKSILFSLKTLIEGVFPPMGTSINLKSIFTVNFLEVNRFFLEPEEVFLIDSQFFHLRRRYIRMVEL